MFYDGCQQINEEVNAMFRTIKARRAERRSALEREIMDRLDMARRRRMAVAKASAPQPAGTR